MQILPNISRSKGNQTLRFGQLIENNMRNISRDMRKYEKLFASPFLKNKN